ncbi:MAG: leucine--tRNA ligase [Leptospiraceae bacterium]|nr:leucine--tRNA ligase [Leptospiraceae bacterium]MCP5497381.1 leucine--tRNA ligase [Leptospiraceae bacterium]
MDYPFQEIENKWQKKWEQSKTFQTNISSDKPKFYCLDMFPYPSGAGLHVGHPEGYTATDIISRYKRMKGFEVLHPMGWDAFGLPAERYAMTTGIHPSITTSSNIDTFRKQIKMLGLSYDWSREISTTSSEYYKFTQWIFLKIYNSYYDKKENKAKPIDDLIKQFESHGTSKLEDPDFEDVFTSADWLAKNHIEKEAILSKFRLVYLASVPVNWCEQLGTVLANEEVDEWIEKGYTVVRKPMRQYMMRITNYAERLLKDLELVSWPVSTLEMQRNWIGKSEGMELDFQAENQDVIKVFTTRPDTLFGATYLVLAPEHPLVEKLTAEDKKKDVEKYRKKTESKSDIDRTDLAKEKTGVFTGAYAYNPVFKNHKIPIWISDYVLLNYGTGAIMAVPAHDERDFMFAKKFNLEIKHVIHGAETEDMCFDSKESYCINSSSVILSIDGLSYESAFDKIATWAEEKNIGQKKVRYKLRDWLFARQRYWGEPIPLVHFPDGYTKALPESELPLLLPDLKEFKPSGTGESPLANASEWLTVYDSELKMTGRRETNTMPQWAGSCWYYLRYIDPNNSERFCSPVLEKKWMSVDLYVGGAEHAVLHLLYSRFWHKILFDLGYVSTPEPFKKLVHQGLILGENKMKMSKSLNNVVNPDDVVREYGADSLRLFEMFMGPFETVKPWSMKGVEGVFRFLNRVWRLYIDKKSEALLIDDSVPELEDWKVLHKTIKKVEEDIEAFSFNTAISQMMIFVNHFTPKQNRPRQILEPFLLVLSSFAPHVAEELWERLGNTESLAFQKYPDYNQEYVQEDLITIVVQVNGKLRGEFQAETGLEKEEAIRLAKQNDKVIPFIEGKTIKKEIFVPNKLVNLVV